MPASWFWYIAGAGTAFMMAALFRVLSRSNKPQPGRTTAQWQTPEPAAGTPPIPDLVQQLIESGDKIGAIKALRKATGMDLTSAHSAVSNWHSPDGSVRVHQTMTFATSANLPPEIIDLIKNGKRIEAVRRLQQEHDMSTRDARSAVQAVTEPNSATDFNAPQSNPVSQR